MFRIAPLFLLVLLPLSAQAAPFDLSRVRAVDFIDDEAGWAVGEDGAIWRTDSSGHQWQPQASGVTSTLRDVLALDLDRAWVVGDGGIVLRTNDGGVSWQRDDLAPAMDFEAIWLGEDGAIGLLSRDGRMAIRESSGDRWKIRSSIFGRRRAVRRPGLPPETLVRIGDTATLDSAHYGITGVATVVSDRLIRLSNFRSNGSAPGLDLRIGLSTGSRANYPVLLVIGRQVFNGATIDLEIPEGMTLDDFDTFTIWCFEFDVLITEARFQRP